MGRNRKDLAWAETEGLIVGGSSKVSALVEIGINRPGPTSAKLHAFIRTQSFSCVELIQLTFVGYSRNKWLCIVYLTFFICMLFITMLGQWYLDTIKMQNTCSTYQVLEKDEVRLWDSFPFRASMNTQDIILKELNFLCGKIFFFVVTNYFR